MWSGPRNLSTALMRSFENRDDTIVLDEPFYAYYLKKTKLKHPLSNKIIETYQNVEKEILNNITTIPRGYKIYFQKHMTHHILDSTNLDWIEKGKNCFLIRHPAKVINSYIKKNTLINVNDIGFKKQYEIFEFVRLKLKRKATVINADVLLKNPKIILKKLCYELNINFTEKMMKWPKGKRQTDGLWGKIWYEKVEKSTTFSKYNNIINEIPKKYINIYMECLSIYNKMNKYSL